MSGVVVGVGAIIGAVIGGGSALHGASKQNRNLIKSFKKQMHYMQLNYNYNQAALDRQERSMYDSAVGNLFNMSVNAFQNQSQVEAAQAESGVEGRSQDKIGQVIRGTNLRQKTALKESYEIDVWNVRSQKEALYIETKNAVEQARDNLSNSFIKGAQLYSQVLSGAATGAALGAATAGIGSAIGGAVGGVAGGATSGAVGAGGASAATGASAGIGGAGAVANTSLGAGFLSSYGMAATYGTTAGTTAATAGAGGMSLTTTGLAGAGGLAGMSSLSGVSTGATTGVSTGTSSGFMQSALANYQQYKPYIDFTKQLTSFYNNELNYNYRRRGGYYY